MSEVLTLIVLLGIHSFAKNKTVLFKFVAYTDKSSFSNACQFMDEAKSQMRPNFPSLYIQICLVKALDFGLENVQIPYMGQ